MARNEGRTLSESDIQEFHSKLSKYSQSELRRLCLYFQPDIVYVIENIDLHTVLNELCYREAITAQEAQTYKNLDKQCDSSTVASILVEDMFEQNGNTVLKMWVSLCALQRMYSHPNLLGMLDEIIENGICCCFKVQREHGLSLEKTDRLWVYKSGTKATCTVIEWRI